MATGLASSGFDTFAVAYSIRQGGSLTVELVPGPKTESVTANDAIEVIFEEVPEVTGHVDVVVSESVTSGLDAAFGGMQMKNGSGKSNCTSGFSVTKISNGVSGVATAGHCSDTQKIVHPGHATHDLTYKAGHQDAYGDVEWHTTTTSEPAKFYGSPTSIRNVTSIKTNASLQENEVVCLYGRKTNERDCSARVSQTSVTCYIEGQWLNRVVRMNKRVGDGGDSGGPWSYTTKAYGIHTGYCVNKDVWTKADFFDEALGIKVKLS